MKNSFYAGLKKLSVLLMILFVFGCKKAESNYIMNQYEYSAGDMLLVENYSINSDGTKWEVISPENEVIQTSEVTNPNLVIGIMDPDGLYNLKLTSSSQKGKSSSVDEKPFLVKTVRAYLTINKSGNGDHKDYLVYIDNQLIGESIFNGAFQAKIPLGNRIVKLVAENDEKTQTIVFEEGDWEYMTF